jgi:hypothetical protein
MACTYLTNLPANFLYPSSRSAGLVTQLVCPRLHFVDAGPVGIDVGNGSCGASLDAGGVAAAQIALLHFAGFLHIVDSAKRAGNGAHLAAYAGRFVHYFGASGFIYCDSFYGARMQAPCLIALRAGVGYFFTCVMKVKYFNARFAGGIRAVVFKTTGHFALQAPRAFVGVDVQDFLHTELLWVKALRGVDAKRCL